MVNKAKRSSFRIPKTAWDHSYKIPDFLLAGDWRSVSPCLALAGDTNFTVLRNIFLTAPTFLISINGKWLYCWVVPPQTSDPVKISRNPLTFPTMGIKSRHLFLFFFSQFKVKVNLCFISSDSWFLLQWTGEERFGDDIKLRTDDLISCREEERQ